jgi:hypothetical protein
MLAVDILQKQLYFKASFYEFDTFSMYHQLFIIGKTLLS